MVKKQRKASCIWCGKKNTKTFKKGQRYYCSDICKTKHIDYERERIVKEAIKKESQ